MDIRVASKSDARTLAILINLAGEGIPEHMWQNMARGNQTAIDVGAVRAAREEGGFSYTNAMVCTQSDSILGMILAYQLPDPYETGDLDDYPGFIRPLIVLEAKTPGSWYVNALATFETHRGKGVARLLLSEAQTKANQAGCDCMSLIVSSENTAACRLYDHMDFQEICRETVTPCPGLMHGGDWILMVKPTGQSQQVTS